MIPITSSLKQNKPITQKLLPISRLIIRKPRAISLVSNNSNINAIQNPALNNDLSPLKLKSAIEPINHLQRSSSKIITRKNLPESTKHNSSSTLTLNDSSSSLSLNSQNFSKNFEFASISRTGIVNNKPKLHNQDSLLVLKGLNKNPNQHLVAVFDGHGPEGHNVSKFLQSQFSIDFPKFLLDSKQKIFVDSSDQTIKACIDSVNQKILHSTIDIEYSGSTLLAVYINDSEFVCANIGDSQAAIISYDKQWTYKIVNKVHRPNDVQEKKRIESFGGRVEKLKDSGGNLNGPLRVWNNKSGMPGLAISRSIGDLYIKEFGVIHEPEVFCMHLKSADKFVVVASDGLWDMIKASQVVEILAGCWENMDLLGAVASLHKTVFNRALGKGKNVDDISIVIMGRK